MCNVTKVLGHISLTIERKEKRKNNFTPSDLEISMNIFHIMRKRIHLASKENDPHVAASSSDG